MSSGVDKLSYGPAIREKKSLISVYEAMKIFSQDEIEAIEAYVACKVYGWKYRKKV